MQGLSVKQRISGSFLLLIAVILATSVQFYLGAQANEKRAAHVETYDLTGMAGFLGIETTPQALEAGAFGVAAVGPPLLLGGHGVHLLLMAPVIMEEAQVVIHLTMVVVEEVLLMLELEVMH